MNIKKNCQDTETNDTIKEASAQLQYMSNTIENFRNFYNPSKSKIEFSIKDAVENISKMISSSIKYINIITEKDFKFYGNQNEFEQVILNIINNAKDACVERDIKEPNIEIIIKEPTITISDNAGGIEKKYLDKIFEPYFSTKKESDGIGLYIAKTIVEREMGGKLNVKNSNYGSSFTILLKRLNPTRV
jgi:signal transduction histidine kinase